MYEWDTTFHILNLYVDDQGLQAISKIKGQCYLLLYSLLCAQTILRMEDFFFEHTYSMFSKLQKEHLSEQVFLNSTNISHQLWYFSEEFLKAYCEFYIKLFHVFTFYVQLILKLQFSQHLLLCYDPLKKRGICAC